MTPEQYYFDENTPIGKVFDILSQWGVDTFGPVSPQTIVRRANTEMNELLDAVDLTQSGWSQDALFEAADVVMILTRAPGLLQALIDKMNINHQRQFIAHGDGTGNRVIEQSVPSSPNLEPKIPEDSIPVYRALNLLSDLGLEAFVSRRHLYYHLNPEKEFRGTIPIFDGYIRSIDIEKVRDTTPKAKKTTTNVKEAQDYLLGLELTAFIYRRRLLYSDKIDIRFRGSLVITNDTVVQEELDQIAVQHSSFFRNRTQKVG